MKTVKFLLAALVLIVAAILVAMRLRTDKVEPSATAIASTGTGAVSALPESGEAHATAAMPEAGTDTAAESGSLKTQKAPDPEFSVWISNEAKQMDLPHVDSAAKEKQIGEVAAKLTPGQSRQLLETVRNPAAPAAEKILSTYLLVEAGPRAERELKELIAAPVAESGPAHSEAEMNNMRDKTLRIMALDGMFSRAQKDRQARAALAQTIDQIQDPYVKKYARQRLSRLEH